MAHSDLASGSSHSTGQEEISISLNGRVYREPKAPTVVICVDGCDPDYIAQGVVDGVIPTIAAFLKSGFGVTADAVMPTFTNPNNMSIVTGAPPEVHGISGNYYLDRQTGKEVMVTDAHLLRSETILGLFSQRGLSTVAVTAKDKLRRALGYNMRGISFSSEYADRCTVAENGIENVEALVGRPRPDQYSPDLSLFVLDAGIKLLDRDRPDIMYLSLSDYVQHKHAPGEREANAFYAELDRRVHALVDRGAVVGITADHGMSAKTLPDGSPALIYLEDRINERFGAGMVRIICPITDPFVRHHGALGSFVRGYVLGDAPLAEIIDFCAALPGINLVLDKNAACARFELPADREGDFIAVADPHVVLGARRSDHDLSALGDHKLRSHGGLSEQRVPFILSHPLNAEYRAKGRGALRNFDIFEFALNGVAV